MAMTYFRRTNSQGKGKRKKQEEEPASQRRQRDTKHGEEEKTWVNFWAR
jgi:hypothetical protein